MGEVYMRRILISLFSLMILAALQNAGAEARAEEPLQPEQAFKVFVERWMEDLSEETARRRAQGFLFGTEGVSYRAAAPEDFAIRTQETGKAAAPYVGILTYTEDTWECADASRESCKVVHSIPITEIFPYKDGSWQH
jgi:hypothetical protein